MEAQQTLQIPSFTLYPVTTEDMKTCYESQAYKVLCSLSGPYYQRRATHLAPAFNIRITQAHFSAAAPLSAEQVVRLERKLHEVLEVMIVSGKYQRMTFDVSMEIVQFNTNNPLLFLLAPLLTLLSYSAILKGLEVTSAFSCSAAYLRKDALAWEYSLEQRRENSDHLLVLCSDHRDQRSILTEFEGQYSFATYERLASALQEANDELNRFQLEKASEVYDLFHQ